MSTQHTPEPWELHSQLMLTARQHQDADEASGRLWECGCGACRQERERMGVVTPTVFKGLLAALEKSRAYITDPELCEHEARIATDGNAVTAQAAVLEAIIAAIAKAKGDV